ncbi:hypothetical protein PG997_012514 [Apiospora hydei]|uniref:Metallo-beta-lactamase domain-containing protein n=1 Tax=Apiospora hydei TaxID=1337664 RepID=A0ABR1V4D0_9PEZI
MPQAPVPTTVSLSALRAGHLTLPEHLFVTDADPERRNTVPSLAFLIRHAPSKTNLVFDLGVKRDLSGYAPAMAPHIAARQPAGAGADAEDDAAASLRRGGLDPATDVDFVVLSHVHWDHVGTPADFAAATFLVGSGTLEVLRNGAGPRYPAEIFRRDELPWDRTLELPPVPGRANGGAGGYYETHAPRHTPMPKGSLAKLPPRGPSSVIVDGRDGGASCAWKPLAGFPHTLDLYGDGSVYVVDSPAISTATSTCWCVRAMEFAEYPDNQGGVRSVHTDTEVARTTLDGIKRFVEAGIELEGRKFKVEVVVAHDAAWAESNRGRFWPGTF